MLRGHVVHRYEIYLKTTHCHTGQTMMYSRKYSHSDFNTDFSEYEKIHSKFFVAFVTNVARIFKVIIVISFFLFFTASS